MNRRQLRHIALGLMAAAALAGSGQALADRGGHGHFHRGGGARVGIGITLGPGFFGYPYYYPPPAPYYYWPPVVAAPAAPPQYIERGDDLADQGGPAVQPAPAWWYHCARPEGYYPYVQACPGGWQRVPAQPPAN